MLALKSMCTPDLLTRMGFFLTRLVQNCIECLHAVAFTASPFTSATLNTSETKLEPDLTNALVAERTRIPTATLPHLVKTASRKRGVELTVTGQ